MQQKGAVFFVKKITVLLTAAVLLLSACSSATLNSAGKELEDTLASAADSSNPYVQMTPSPPSSARPAGSTSRARTEKTW